MVFARLQRKRDAALVLTNRLSGPEWKAGMARIERNYQIAMEAELDLAHGRCLFMNAGCASVMMETLRNRDGHDYQIGASVVMPNHVHALFRLLYSRTLAEVMQSWKSVSSHRINELSGSRGVIWQSDYFDTTIRDTRQLERSVRYVLDNAAKAGLRGWKWTHFDAERYAEWSRW
jgi:REP element-mobilizing transposase RayT